MNSLTTSRLRNCFFRCRSILAAVSVCVVGVPYANAAGTLVGHWELDETSGTVAYDSAGSNNSDHKNGPTFDTGIEDGALRFDGTNDYCAANANYQAETSFTVMAWIKADTLGSLNPIVGSIYGAESKYPRLFITNEERIGFHIKSGTSISGIATPKESALAGEWIHVAATFDGSSYAAKLYINGEERGSGTLGGTPNTGGGKLLFGHDASTFFDGLIDDVRIYDDVMTQAEVEAVYDATKDDTADPDTPASLTATGVTHEAVSLDWADTADNVGVDHYVIYRDSTEVGTSVLSAYSDFGLSANTTYAYTVSAVDAAGNEGSVSSSANGTTLAGASESDSSTFASDDVVVMTARSDVFLKPDETSSVLVRPLPGAHATVQSANGRWNATDGEHYWLVEFYPEGYQGWVNEDDLTDDDDAGLKAFPTAEGYGKDSVGGRGGTVYIVTNLNNSGAGSLRAACEASGARIVVFEVAGYIDLDSPIEIDDPYITIAGQTAPGDGITLRGDGDNEFPCIEIDAADVIIRHMRFRPDKSDDPSCCVDAIGLLAGADEVIIDHCSLSWAVDENFSSSSASNVTVQWSIMSEGLAASNHSSSSSHSRGALVGDNSDDQYYSLHHNLFAHNETRNPLIATNSTTTDLANNVVYNPESLAMHTFDDNGDPRINVVGNYFKLGPDSNVPTQTLYIMETLTLSPPKSGTGDFELYLAGNIDEQYRMTDTQDEDDSVSSSDGSFVVSTRHTGPYVNTTLAARAFEDVLNNVGCRVPAQDDVDARVILEVRRRTGQIPDAIGDVGGYPTLSSGTAPTDTDDDGMPDAWEALFSNEDITPTGDMDSDGYTNLEEYLNELAGDQETEDAGTLLGGGGS